MKGEAGPESTAGGEGSTIGLASFYDTNEEWWIDYLKSDGGVRKGLLLLPLGCSNRARGDPAS